VGAPLRERGAYPGRQGLRKTQPTKPPALVENCQRAALTRLSMPHHRMPQPPPLPHPPRPQTVGREQSPTQDKRTHPQQQRRSQTPNQDPPNTPLHMPRVRPTPRRRSRPRHPPRRRRSRPRNQPPPHPPRPMPRAQDSSRTPASDRSTSRPAKLMSGWGTTAWANSSRVKGGCAFAPGHVFASDPALPATVETMPSRSPREDRKAPHGRPGRNLSARARSEREARHRNEVEEQAQLEDRTRRARPPAPIVCPRGKAGWSEAIARKKLALYAESSRPLRPVRVYLCQHCAAWHLTSLPEQAPKVAPPASFDPSRPRIAPPSPRLRPPSSSGSS